MDFGDIATSNGGSVAAESAQFVISSIGFNIVRMDMPAYFYEAMANVLAAGTVYNYIIQIIKYLPVNHQQINQELPEFH